jgi:hypothetical protein
MRLKDVSQAQSRAAAAAAEVATTNYSAALANRCQRS